MKFWEKAVWLFMGFFIAFAPGFVTVYTRDVRAQQQVNGNLAQGKKVEPAPTVDPKISPEAKERIKDLQLSQLRIELTMDRVRDQYENLSKQDTDVNSKLLSAIHDALVELKLDPDKYSIDPQTYAVIEKPDTKKK